MVGALYLFYQYPTKIPSSSFYLTLVIITLGTYVIPVASSLLLFKFNLITSLEMGNAKDRKIPYFIGGISYFSIAYILSQMPIPSGIFQFLLGSGIVISVHFFLLPFFKPSAHMAGIGGFLGLIMGFALKWDLAALPEIAICLLVAGLLGTARLRLKAHTFFELAFGFFSSWLLIFVLIFRS